MRAATRVVFGAEAREVSLLYTLFWPRAGGGLMHLGEVEGGAQQERVVEGAQELSIRMAARLGEAVVLSAPVHAIEAIEASGGRESRVVVRSAAGTYEARRVVVAVPPALAGRIRFEPALPPLGDQLLSRYPMGGTGKCMAFYERGVLARRRPLGRGRVRRRGDQRRSTTRATTARGRRGSRSSPGRRRARGRPPRERRQPVVATSERLFGWRAASPIDYVEHDWSTEEWTRGCPVGIAPPGLLTTCGEALRRPVGPIHWAGTETATEWAGCMEGALASGERAAREVLAAL